MGLVLCLNTTAAQDRAIIDSLEALIPTLSDTNASAIYYELGHLHYKHSLSTDSSEYYLNKIMDIAEQYDHNTSRMQGYYLQGQIEYRRENFGKAKIYFDKANEYLDSTQLSKWNSKVPNALGVIYIKMEDPEKALVYFKEAERVAEILNAYELLGPTFTNIAIIFGNLNETDQGRKYFHKALYAARKSNNKINELGTMYSMVSMLTNEQQFDSALYYTNSYLDQSLQLDYEEGILRANLQLGQIYTLKEAHELSKQYANAVIDFEAENKSNTYLLSAYRVLAHAHAKLGETNKAKVAIDSVFQLLDRIPLQIYRANTYQILAGIYDILGQYEKAYDYQYQSSQLLDSLYGEEQRNKVVLLQNMYELEKKERQLLELNQKNERQEFLLRQRNTLLIGTSLISILLLLTFYLYTQQRVLKEKQKVSQIEYRLFRLQMNPHFLFNTLSAIQSYLFDKSDIKKAIRYLSKFSQLMRQVLEYSRETQISLEDEIKTLENYLALQQLRYDNGFDYEIEIAPDIDPWETQIPPILAQPFVENAIEHGKVHLAENGKIWVRFQKNSDSLNLIIEDNGIGREKARQNVSLKKHKSLASEITRDRIDILSNFNKKEVDFKIIDLPEKGTKVIFELPILEKI